MRWPPQIIRQPWWIPSSYSIPSAQLKTQEMSVGRFYTGHELLHVRLNQGERVPWRHMDPTQPLFCGRFFLEPVENSFTAHYGKGSLKVWHQKIHDRSIRDPWVYIPRSMDSVDFYGPVSMYIGKYTHTSFVPAGSVMPCISRTSRDWCFRANPQKKVPPNSSDEKIQALDAVKNKTIPRWCGLIFSRVRRLASAAVYVCIFCWPAKTLFF